MTNNAPVEEWEVEHERLWGKLQEIKQMRDNSRKPRPSTLIDAARALCDRDAPPPTREELVWLYENLTEHRQCVEKLIALVGALLEGDRLRGDVAAGGEEETSETQAVVQR